MAWLAALLSSQSSASSHPRFTEVLHTHLAASPSSVGCQRICIFASRSDYSTCLCVSCVPVTIETESSFLTAVLSDHYELGDSDLWFVWHEFSEGATACSQRGGLWPRPWSLGAGLLQRKCSSFREMCSWALWDPAWAAGVWFGCWASGLAPPRLPALRTWPCCSWCSGLCFLL